ncbi:hypothetical protein M8818_002051 [Zalaria obscura]|uniref:Uncharacterized protein n=1 Tax=Zalaria obscura TaxID=2024903 RepID=A0ACC3SJI0_9PEZI
MAPSILHLPNGHNLTVTPVFGGLSFKSQDLNNHHSPFPPGWTIVLHCEGDEEPGQSSEDGGHKRKTFHRYKQPSLRNDHLFISSISNPSNYEFKPAHSPTRQIAMMLWATLWWYFHQPEPDMRLVTPESANTAELGRPKGQWRININREGILKSKLVMQKLERMGLLASEDSTVGADPDDTEGWSHMFVSQEHFWQLDARIYLFQLPLSPSSPFPSSSPVPSRPGSPSMAGSTSTGLHEPTAAGQAHSHPGTPGPFTSGSHLPTYYPPAPTQYIFTNNIRHPIRPKPPRQGETFYTRYIPSLGEYLSFRVASLSKKPVTHQGPTSAGAESGTGALGSALRSSQSISDSAVPTMSSLALGKTDAEYLHKWMNDPRVAYSWGEQGDLAHQEAFLKAGLESRHSFPVIGCFDGKPFGYFEIYWVKEDRLGMYLGGNVDNYDRGIHVLVGEQEFRGPHRIRVWLSALVHYCWLADKRTEAVVLEPRVDNEKLKKYCEEVGFWKEKEISFPHKQSNFMKIKRDGWRAPAL